ncbi:MAG: SMC-Scp complex subunit ScpB [Proteobacteria bacterium]|nr:SMC-Scp complex subunit ScpB [Pseudomonadota bacterium]
MNEVNNQHLRLLEAVLFAASEPLDEMTIATRLPDGADVTALLTELARLYENRGVNLTRAGGLWAFRTAADLAAQLRVHTSVPRKLSRAAIETLAIIAYHQPVTRAEIEEIRGVGLSKSTLDILFEAGWIGPKGRRRSPGRPVTWGTAASFLHDFGLESLDDLPGIDELKAAGLLDKRPAIDIAGPLMAKSADDQPPEANDDAPDAEANTPFQEREAQAQAHEAPAQMNEAPGRAGEAAADHPHAE